MDIFTRNKFLVRIIVILILLNLFSMSYLWWDKRDRPENGVRSPRRAKENSAHILRDKLGFSKAQEEAVVQLREDFMRREEQITALIRSQRDSMNMVMFHVDSDTTLLKSLARRVSENEYQMELLRIEQAKKLKEICTKEQLLEFQNLVKSMRDYFQPQKKKD